ncbi:MAG: LapA family protein [Fibrobacteria bacterium]|nr:LapA family protein [Fibrobacteria bacterium]
MNKKTEPEIKNDKQDLGDLPPIEVPKPKTTSLQTKLKRIGIIGVLLLLVLFTIQNLFTIQINFMLWKFKLLLPMMILFFFLCGLAVGWLLRWFYQK